MIEIKKEIEKLKSNSSEYNKAIDDVLELFNQMTKSCKVVHSKSGLYYNGYENFRPTGKNTLSPTNAKVFSIFKLTDDEILEKAFSGHIVVRDNIRYIRNVIVYAGSEIHKILEEFYTDYEYLPLNDFSIEKI